MFNFDDDKHFFFIISIFWFSFQMTVSVVVSEYIQTKIVQHKCNHETWVAWKRKQQAQENGIYLIRL